MMQQRDIHLDLLSSTYPNSSCNRVLKIQYHEQQHNDEHDYEWHEDVEFLVDDPCTYEDATMPSSS